jgi:hypothetical protein
MPPWLLLRLLLPLPTQLPLPRQAPRWPLQALRITQALLLQFLLLPLLTPLWLPP